MTPIKWLIIAWFVQTLCLLYMLYDLHGRITMQRKYLVALTTILDVNVDKILEIVDKVESYKDLH